ncbi:M20 family metallopeptidase [Haloechinothrix sp. LS1_15]|uniref:M20 metallopeptidase family protein n=1 Tax=Haloechinothrix sp. LS1_15 TaxID=2652248 RepID=UPI0029481843|nr:M20 family metallopeptidase [Haloechinothrix sp. LS1_15]MDV6011254.1 amidohydrolase [Haloechinothrix sp. LS1_15]
MNPTANPDPTTRFDGLLADATALRQRTVALRRTIHRNPELGLELPDTQRAVLAELDDLPMEITRGENTSGITAVLRGDAAGPAVLLRGDMDALPLQEETGLEYASERDGVMHACGHDTHVAMLATAARLLAARRDQLAGSVVLMFQPGEEGHHGARYMLDEGVLDAAGEPVSEAFALHIHGNTTSGLVFTRQGPILAAADQFHVQVTGRGGHGSAPHDACDPVPAAAEMVGALQTNLTRKVSVFDPAVLSVTRIAAGTTSNIIPERAELEGTIRTLSAGNRTVVREMLHRVCSGVAAAHGCEVDVTVTPGYAPTVNAAAPAQRALDLAAGVLGQRYSEAVDQPIMGAEDFSYVLDRVPGALAFLGACPPDLDPAHAPSNHSNRVVFDEAALPHGAAMYAAFALDALR